MTSKKGFILGMMLCLILMSTSLVFSQESQEGNVAVGPPIQEVPAEPEIQWLYGEVISVDVDNNQINVKTIDLETDTEKEMIISVDDKTIYENIKSLDEIRPKDTVAIDYIVSPEGNNIAKNISVEKPESPEVLREEVIPQTTPGDLQPVPTTEETEEKK